MELVQYTYKTLLVPKEENKVKIRLSLRDRIFNKLRNKNLTVVKNWLNKKSKKGLTVEQVVEIIHFITQIDVSQVKADLITHYLLRYTKNLNYYGGLEITNIDVNHLTIINSLGIEGKELVAYLFCIVINNIKSDRAHLANITDWKDPILMTSNISLPKFIEQFYRDNNKVTYRSLIIKVDYFNK